MQERISRRSQATSGCRRDEPVHVAIAAGAGCGLAWNAISDIKVLVDRMCNLQLRHPVSMMRLIAEHETIMTAIDRRDADAAMRSRLNAVLADLTKMALGVGRAGLPAALLSGGLTAGN